MKNVLSLIENLSFSAIAQLKTLVELQRLRLVLKLAELFSSFITSFFILLLFSLMFIMLNLAAALWLGVVLGAIYYGFLLLALVYLVLLVLFLLFFKKAFKGFIRNIFIKQTLH